MHFQDIRCGIAPTIAFVTLALLGVSSAHAKTVEASSLQYKNNGAYSAEFYVEYNREYEGETVTCQLYRKNSGMVETGKSTSIDIRRSDLEIEKGSRKACLTDSGTIPLKTEVWGRVKIEFGENQKCRKDTKIVVTRSGGEVKYRTGGTTYNNNRCKVSSWP